MRQQPIVSHFKTFLEQYEASLQEGAGTYFMGQQQGPPPPRDIPADQQLKTEELDEQQIPLLAVAPLIALPMHQETVPPKEALPATTYLQEEAAPQAAEEDGHNALQEAFHKVKESRLGKNIPEHYVPENPEKRLMDDFIKKFTQEVKDSLHNRGPF